MALGLHCQGTKGDRGIVVVGRIYRAQGRSDNDQHARSTGLAEQTVESHGSRPSCFI